MVVESVLYQIRNSISRTSGITDNDMLTSIANNLIKDLHDGPKSYLASAGLVLESSDKASWGVVKDYEGDFTWKHGEGILAGHWSKSPDGLIRLMLNGPIESLVDGANERYAHYAKMRELGMQPVKGSKYDMQVTVAPAGRISSINTIVDERAQQLSDLRKLLGGV